MTRCVKAASDLTISRDLISSPVSGEHVTRQAAFVDKNLLSSAPLPIRASFPTQARFQPRFRDENRPVGPVPGCRKAESILEIDIDPPSLRNESWNRVGNRPSNLRVFSSDRFEYWKAYMVFQIDFQTMIFERAFSFLSAE